MTFPLKFSAKKAQELLLPSAPGKKQPPHVRWYVAAGAMVLLLLALLLLGGLGGHGEAGAERVSLDLADIPPVVLDKEAELARARNRNCTYWDCFNVYRCGQRAPTLDDGGGGGDGEMDAERISIYVYPLKEYLDADSRRPAGQLSREFYRIVQTVVDSPYYTANPNEACLFLPTLDTLNQNRIDTTLVGKALASLP